MGSKKKDEPKPMKRVSDIDDIFASKKKLKSTQETIENPELNVKKTDIFIKKPADTVKVIEFKEPVKSKSQDIPADFSTGRLSKSSREIDGLPLFDIKEICSQTGGDTDDCPFDCQCCY